MSDTIDADRAAEALCRATTQVLADMAFIDAACAPSDEAVAYDVCAAIDLLRPLSCRLELRMPRTLADTISDTLGAGDAAGGGAGTTDTELEMVNILAGVFISEYFGPGADIKLELPTFLYEPMADEGTPICSVRCDAEGTPCMAIIRSIRYRY